MARRPTRPASGGWASGEGRHHGRAHRKRRPKHQTVPLAGLRSGVLIAGENLPGHWQLNREPAFDLDPVGLDELRAVQQAYRDAATTRRATEVVR